MSTQRVLIVEDDTIIRGFLSDALRMQGFSTTSAADGVEAVEQLAQAETDLVLTDVRMPNMDGLELCRRITTERPGLPVVLITGQPASDDEALLVESGARAILRKPIRIQHLYEVICDTVGPSESKPEGDVPDGG